MNFFTDFFPELSPRSVVDPRYAQCPVTTFTPKRDLYQTEMAQQNLLRGVTQDKNRLAESGPELRGGEREHLPHWVDPQLTQRKVLR